VEGGEGRGVTSVRVGSGGRRRLLPVRECEGLPGQGGALGAVDEGDDDERLLRGRERKGLPRRGGEASPWRMGAAAPRTAATTCLPAAAGSFQGLDPDLEREREAYLEREMGEVK